MTGYSVEFSPDAARDVHRAYEWYEERSAQAAKRFKEGVDIAANSFAQRFMSLPPIDENFRWVRVGRYPYTLIGRLTQDQRVVVVAVAHTSRDSGFWRSH